eukprot:CFRG2536T1
MVNHTVATVVSVGFPKSTITPSCVVECCPRCDRKLRIRAKCEHCGHSVQSGRKLRFQLTLTVSLNSRCQFVTLWSDSGSNSLFGRECVQFVRIASAAWAQQNIALCDQIALACIRDCCEGRAFRFSHYGKKLTLATAMEPMAENSFANIYETLLLRLSGSGKVKVPMDAVSESTTDACCNAKAGCNTRSSAPETRSAAINKANNTNSSIRSGNNCYSNMKGHVERRDNTITNTIRSRSHNATSSLSIFDSCTAISVHTPLVSANVPLLPLLHSQVSQAQSDTSVYTQLKPSQFEVYSSSLSKPLLDDAQEASYYDKMQFSPFPYSSLSPRSRTQSPLPFQHTPRTSHLQSQRSQHNSQSTKRQPQTSQSHNSEYAQKTPQQEPQSSNHYVYPVGVTPKSNALLKKRTDYHRNGNEQSQSSITLDTQLDPSTRSSRLERIVHDEHVSESVVSQRLSCRIPPVLNGQQSRLRIPHCTSPLYTEYSKINKGNNTSQTHLSAKESPPTTTESPLTQISSLRRANRETRQNITDKDPLPCTNSLNNTPSANASRDTKTSRLIVDRGDAAHTPTPTNTPSRYIGGHEISAHKSEIGWDDEFLNQFDVNTILTPLVKTTTLQSRPHPRPKSQCHTTRKINPVHTNSPPLSVNNLAKSVGQHCTADIYSTTTELTLENHSRCHTTEHHPTEDCRDGKDYTLLHSRLAIKQPPSNSITSSIVEADVVVHTSRSLSEPRENVFATPLLKGKPTSQRLEVLRAHTRTDHCSLKPASTYSANAHSRADAVSHHESNKENDRISCTTPTHIRIDTTCTSTPYTPRNNVDHLGYDQPVVSRTRPRATPQTPEIFSDYLRYPRR